MIALEKKQFSSCPPFNIDPAKQYIATIQTEKVTPPFSYFLRRFLAVNSFVFLAKQGWYNGVTFHRVIPGFAAQTGDPSNTGKGKPGIFFQQ
ncbi:MAG: peptidylprolyl isomerase [Anaerolineales bacterium]|nr:peptidylprolyl isomerase [Anaerolineales bacterium]